MNSAYVFFQTCFFYCSIQWAKEFITSSHWGCHRPEEKKLASAVKALHCCNIFRISHKKNLLEQKGNFNSWNERSIQVVSRKNNKSSILVSKVCRYLGRNVSDIYKSIGHIHLPLDRAILFIIQYLFMIVFGEVLVHIKSTYNNFIKFYQN